jgi:hypothetical protein
MTFSWSRNPRLVPMASRVLVVGMLVGLGAGCPQSTPPPANDNSSSGTAEGEILNLKTNLPVSELNLPISVFYTATGSPSQVDGFYRQVADDSPTGGQIGNDVITNPNLPVGSNLSFFVDPVELGVGFFRIGLYVTSGGVREEVLSDGVLKVEGAPNPVFRQPESFAVVDRGDSQFIQWDNRDPEGVVQWRLFLLNEESSRDEPADQLGTQLAIGSGNVGSHTLQTSTLLPGRYEIGVSATDSGRSIAATVADGESFRIKTVREVFIEVVDPQSSQMPPTFTWIAPGDTLVELFRDEPFTLEFQGMVREPGATGQIELWYDADNNATNGFTSIAIDLPTSTRTFALPVADMAEGEYRIGAGITDGINQPVVSYATGAVRVVKTATLLVTAPTTTVSIPPSPAGSNENTVEVTWTTNVPVDEGTVEVFALRVGGGATEIPVLPASPLTITSAQFGSAQAGVFEIYVRIRFTDGSTPLVDKAPQDVRVSSLPTVLWVGEIAKESRVWEGAIFQGIQNEDNAGSAFTTAGDLNGDGRDEFVLAARYGKPFFTNPSGIGHGEAYMIFGDTRTSLVGEYNLNSVGTTLLPGVTFAGMRTVNGSDNCEPATPNDQTDGLSDISMIPDADNDGLPDLVFGFPFVNSRGWCLDQEGNVEHGLDARGQFNSGGVVIVSSLNPLLKNPEGEDPTIFLDEVGQNFSAANAIVGWPAGLVIATAIAADQCMQRTMAEEPACRASSPNCTPGGNDLFDIITGPSIGFVSQLATQTHIVLGLPLDNICGVEFAAQVCGNVLGGPGNPEVGSGFFADTLAPAAPFGARIVGKSSGDRFGTSVTFSRASTNPDQAGDLIISAPARTGTSAEIMGLTGTSSGSGVAYLMKNRFLWGVDTVFGDGLVPPRPHQYIVDAVSHCGDNRAPFLDASHIVGDQSDAIRNIVGIDDFNADGRNDFAVGAPTSGGGQGRVYIAFRRAESVEGDFVLPKLELDPGSASNPGGNPERLDGVLVISDTPALLGASLATGVDFNDDGISDLVIGSPGANAGIGEIIIVFGDPNFRSPVNGITVDALLKARNADGQPRAIRITGNTADVNGQFGFNVANAGDVDGDGLNDLLVSAPNGTPRFDPNPLDGVDQLTATGIDADEDGIKDDVSGPNGVPDGCPGVAGCDSSYDNLLNAGLVYVISSRNRVHEITPDAAGIIGISVSQLGTSNLRGLMIAGRRAGDRIGGGDAGDAINGGIVAKLNRGRSFGLASAGDVDGDGRADILIGSILSDPGTDPQTGRGRTNAGEAYLIYGSVIP